MVARGYVRLSLPAEARDIAVLQLAVWSDPLHPGHSMSGELDLDSLTQVWRRSIDRPPLASYRVLVAVVPADNASSGRVERVVGFAAVAPSDDPDAADDDGAVIEMVVDPSARGEGHEERLVQAAVDTLRADGFTTARWWVASTDDDLRTALAASGWGPDGAHVELAHPSDDSIRLKLIRLHTDIS